MTRDDTAPESRAATLGGGFARLWTASTLSNLADGVFKVALPLVALRFTDSPAVIAGLTVAVTLPWLLFALQAGALADRLDRRRSMAGANVVRVALMTGLALLLAADAGSIWLLYVIALGVGIAETVYDTSAQSILPQVVPRPALSRANGRLYAAELTANEFVGPPLGGLLVTVGAVTAFATPAALWVVAVGALLTLRGSFRVHRETRTTMRADIAEGLRFLWRHRLLRTLALMVGASNFATNATFAIFVLYAVGPSSAMGLSEPAFGLVFGTTAAGALVGALTAERVERRIGRVRSMVVGLLGGVVMVGAPAVSTDPWLVGAAFLVGGVTIALWNVITVSLRQRIVPDALLGRVTSGYRLVAWGARPVGALAGGLLAEVLGLRPVFALMAVLVLGLVGGMVVVTRELDAADRQATAPGT